MKLIFKNGRGQERTIAILKGENCSKKEALRLINLYIDELNSARTDGGQFVSYYTRIWMTGTGNRLCFDVGSWYEFFYLELEEGEVWPEDINVR